MLELCSKQQTFNCRMALLFVVGWLTNIPTQMFFFVCLFVAILCPILVYLKKTIEALIELRKMLIRKQLFDVRLGNC